MKKRIISIVLVLALALSVGSFITVAAETETQTGLSAEELTNQLQQFVDTGKALAARDDWQNIEGAEKAASTVLLETQIAAAEAALAGGDASIIENCLIELFGEWNVEENAFANPEKPYDDFKAPLFLSAASLDAQAAKGEKGYNTKLFYAVNDREHSFENLGRYSQESWAVFVDAVKAIDALTLVDTDSMEKPAIDSATRSEVAALLDTYYAAYDGLVSTRRTAIYEEAVEFLDKCKSDSKFAALYDGSTIVTLETAVKLYEGTVTEIEDYSANWNMEAPDYGSFAKLVAKQEQAAFGIQTAMGNLKLIENPFATTVEEVIAVGRNIVSLSRAYIQDQTAAAAKLGYTVNELYMTGFADYQTSVKDLEMFLNDAEAQLQKPMTLDEKNALLGSVMSSIIKHHDALTEFQISFDYDLLDMLLYPEDYEEDFDEDFEEDED